MAQKSNQKTILLIDPDPHTDALLRSVLTNNAFRIVTVSSGREGLSAIPKEEPHVIISGYHTDDLDGGAIFKEFVKNPKFEKCRRTPFILYSDAEFRDRYGQEFLDLGLNGWFTKPLGAHEFREILINLFMLQETFHRNRELQQEVKRSEYRYRDLLENANDFIFTLDDEGTFVYLNNRFSPLTGWDKEDWSGKPFLSLISPEDRDTALQHYQMAHQGRARIFEARILGKESDASVLSFNITPIFERGSIVGSIGIARDVTEQKMMEKEILDLKNFNESIIQSMEAGLLTTDLEGKITSLNEGAERILGWKAGQAVGKQIKSVLKPQEVDFLLSNPPPPGSLPYSRETELTVKTGKKIAIGFTTTDRIDNTNQKVGTIVSFRDITLLKQMQSEVIRMDRLVSLGVLASGIAHEIKNPLAGIKTMAQACEEEFKENDSRREYLTRIVRQVNRLDDLLKTFFAYARPKTPDRRPHKLSEILREVTGLISPKMMNKGISFVEAFETDLPEVMVDSQQMQQVFLNLILNAVEAMPDGGELVVSAKTIQKPQVGLIRSSKRAAPDGRVFVEIVVSDTGVGIDPEKIDTIFDPFFTTKSTGLGLGLSIVYRIIKEHHGDIIVKSQVGQGSSFSITLPMGVSE